MEQIKILDENFPLTQEDKEFLSEKTGYSVYSIDQILRGHVPQNPRHRELIDLYRRMIFLKKLHRENYQKDLKEI